MVVYAIDNIPKQRVILSEHSESKDPYSPRKRTDSSTSYGFAMLRSE